LIGRISIIAKILFRAKQIKIAKDFEPLFGEPRRARRATKSMGGALRRPKNGFRKIGTSGFGVFIQFRSNLFYQKFLILKSAAPAARHFCLRRRLRRGKGVWGKGIAAAASVFARPSFGRARSRTF